MLTSVYFPDEEYHEDDTFEGSGYDYDYPRYHDDTEDTYDYEESEDQTEPPLQITDETDIYRKPTAPPLGGNGNYVGGSDKDFGFTDENSILQSGQTDKSDYPQNNKNNAKSSSQHSSTKTSTSQQQPVMTAAANDIVKISLQCWSLLLVPLLCGTSFYF